MPKVEKEKPKRAKKHDPISDVAREGRLEEKGWVKTHDLPGLECVIGVDEAGRGPLVGCLLTCACILPEEVKLQQLNDSKQLSEKVREALFEKLTNDPRIIYHYHITERADIDRLGIGNANFAAMKVCVEKVIEKSGKPKHLALIDGNLVPPQLAMCPKQAVVKGDSKCQSISAASIICKVVRDRIMKKLHETFPQYDFAGHKGYGVQKHRDLIETLGPCSEHRMSFNPVKTMIRDGLCDVEKIWGVSTGQAQTKA